jgi:hypothetical protein
MDFQNQGLQKTTIFWSKQGTNCGSVGRKSDFPGRYPTDTLMPMATDQFLGWSTDTHQIVMH